MSKEEGLPLTINAESFGTLHGPGVSNEASRTVEPRLGARTGVVLGAASALGSGSNDPGAELGEKGRGSDVFERWGTVIPPGATLAGRYLIDWFIARGGMGEVYAAYDRELGDRIASRQ